MKKQILCLAAIAILAASLLTGCGSKKDTALTSSNVIASESDLAASSAIENTDPIAKQLEGYWAFTYEGEISSSGIYFALDYTALQYFSEAAAAVKCTYKTTATGVSVSDSEGVVLESDKIIFGDNTLTLTHDGSPDVILTKVQKIEYTGVAVTDDDSSYAEMKITLLDGTEKLNH